MFPSLHFPLWGHANARDWQQCSFQCRPCLTQGIAGLIVVDTERLQSYLEMVNNGIKVAQMCMGFFRHALTSLLCRHGAMLSLSAWHDSLVSCAVCLAVRAERGAMLIRR